MPQPLERLRVLQVVTDTDRRGAQVFACDLARQLVEIDQCVDTVALTSGVTKPALNVAVLGSTSRGWRTLLALRQAMAQADITIAHGSSTLLACALAGVGVNRRWVYRQISDSRFWAASLRRRVRVALALRRASHVVALSSGAARTLHEHLWLPERRATVVPNGVPAAAFSPASQEERGSARERFGVPPDAFVGVYVGALAPEKGVDLAIDAVAATPGTHLLIVGDGPERATLAHQAELCADGRVTFAGGLDDVRPAYFAADVLLLTSRGGDSMPAVLIEAGLCGLPSITCPVGEITDVVQHEATGLVTPIGDQAAIRAAFFHLASNPGDSVRLGRAARDRCLQRFTIEVVAEQWLHLLRQVVGNAAARR